MAAAKSTNKIQAEFIAKLCFSWVKCMEELPSDYENVD